MLDSRSAPRRQADVLTQEVSGTAVLLNPHDGQYYALNDVGRRVWELCDGARTIAEIISLVCQEYDAPEEMVRADVMELLEDLQGERLVVASA